MDASLIGAHELAIAALGIQIDIRGVASFQPRRSFCQQRGLAQMALGFADHDGQVTPAGKPAIMSATSRDQPDRADCGRGQDGRAVGFVIQADIARHDGHVERRAGRADALNRADKAGP